MAKIENSKQTLADVVDFSQGIIPYKTRADGVKNLYIAGRPQGRGWKPLLESAAQVEQYRLAKPVAFVHYGKWLWCERDAKYFEQPKILFHRLRKKLPRQLIGVIDTSKAVNRHSLSNLILLEGHEEEELWAVLALFNSELTNWWFIKRYGPLMEVGGFKVQSIPLPEKWPKLWRSLAVRAKKITEALQASAVAKDGHTRSVHARVAQSHRKAVETLLAKACGLTEEEVRHLASSFQRIVDRNRIEATLSEPEDEG